MSDKVWYGARLLFECQVAGASDLYEERIILISAHTSENAASHARKLGKELLTQYKNDADEDVIWSFVELLDISEILDRTLADGSEVYSHYLKAEEVEQVRRSLASGSLG